MTTDFFGPMSTVLSAVFEAWRVVLGDVHWTAAVVRLVIGREINTLRHGL